MENKTNFPMNSAIYQYYPSRGNCLSCIVCGYNYRQDAPLSTLQKHLRVKHNFSIRRPLSPQSLQNAINEAKSSQPAAANNLSPITSTSHGISRDVCLEDAMVTWLYQEGYSTNIINSPTFKNMFYSIDSNITLPTQERLDSLLRDRNTIKSPSQSKIYRPNFSTLLDPIPCPMEKSNLISVDSLINNSNEARYDTLPPITELDYIVHDSAHQASTNRTNNNLVGTIFTNTGYNINDYISPKRTNTKPTSASRFSLSHLLRPRSPPHNFDS